MILYPAPYLYNMWFQYTHLWGGKMAQWVKHLLCKHEDLSSNPQNPLSKPGLGGLCIAGLGMGQKKGESLQPIGQPA